MYGYAAHYMEIVKFGKSDIYCGVRISRFDGQTPIPVPDIEIISPLDSSGSDQ